MNDTILVDPFWLDKPLESAIGDYDGDTVPDLMVKFDRQAVIDLILKNYQFIGTSGTITLTVTGKLYDGMPFQGSDTVRVVLPTPRRCKAFQI